MAATNLNNFNWNLVTDVEFPNDKVFESSFTLKKYQDLTNKQVKETKKVTAQSNSNTGSTTFFEESSGVKTKIQTRDKDGNQTIWNSDLNKSYFSAEDLVTFTQYDEIVKLSKDKIISENYSNGKFGDLENWTDFQTDINSFDTFTDSDDHKNDSAESSNSFSEDNTAFEGKGYPKSGRTTLRYPTTSIPDELGFDYIRITSYEYTASGTEGLSIKSGKKSAKERLIKEAKKLETIMLPMQPNFSESNAVTWGGDNINPLQLIGAGAAGTLIKGIGNIGQPGMVEGVQAGLKNLTSDIVDAFNDDSTGPALIAYFAGQAVGANVLGRTAGVTLNPNLELLFKGPNLRTFNFNFRFTPRSEYESMEIKQIIRCFKKNMAVQRTSSNLFLKTPNVFTVEYIYNSTGEKSNQLHPYLNIFKPMAMTNFNVNYTPDGSYMTYNDGSLTQYDVQMSFGEIEPIYADEYDGTESGDSDVGKFSDHINMGY